jgi:hypothetical protein
VESGNLVLRCRTSTRPRSPHRAQRVLCMDFPRRRSVHRRRPSTSTRSTYPIATSQRFQLRCWRRSRLPVRASWRRPSLGEARLDRAQTRGRYRVRPAVEERDQAATAARDASDCADKSDGPYSIWSWSAFPCSEEIDCPSRAAGPLEPDLAVTPSRLPVPVKGSGRTRRRNDVVPIGADERVNRA